MLMVFMLLRNMRHLEVASLNFGAAELEGEPPTIGGSQLICQILSPPPCPFIPTPTQKRTLLNLLGQKFSNQNNNAC